MPSASEYDAIIIGGGHNGLVTACYLAKAKWKVLVLERLSELGVEARGAIQDGKRYIATVQAVPPRGSASSAAARGRSCSSRASAA